MKCLLAPLTLPLLNPPPHKPSPPLQDPNEEKDAINSIAPLCLEATTVNQNFSQQVWGQAVCGVCVGGGGGRLGGGATEAVWALGRGRGTIRGGGDAGEGGGGGDAGEGGDVRLWLLYYKTAWPGNYIFSASPSNPPLTFVFTPRRF